MPSSSGYSGTPLPKKLGVKDGHVLWLVNAPADFEQTLGELPAAARLVRKPSGAKRFDVIVLFVRTAQELERGFDSAKRCLAEAGGLWIAWPKKSSSVATNLVDSMVRAHGLRCGLVDNKVCAIDATWSGLRFVVRLRDRGAGSIQLRTKSPSSTIRGAANRR